MPSPPSGVALAPAHEERAWALERLNRAASRVSAAASADAVAGVVLEEALAMTAARCGVLALVDGRDLVFAHRIGMAERAPSRLSVDADAPMPEAVRTGRPVLLDSREEWLERYPVGPKGDFTSFAAVPLLSGGRVLGVLGIGYLQSGPLPTATRDVLAVLAAQSAQGLARAAEYDRVAHAARVLRGGLRPRALPDVPGIRAASRFHPAGADDEVGGDFLDLVPTPGGVLAVVGDVCGKGIEAAVVTGMARHTVRALAHGGASPEGILGTLDATMADEHEGRFLTAVLARLTPWAGGGFSVRVVAAGHPPPIVLRPGAAPEAVPATGLVLGAFDELALRPADLLLAPGDALVLYTDGVTDAGRPPRTLGIDGLLGALAGADPGDAEGIADLIDARVAAMDGERSRDDRAIVVLSVT